MRLFRALLAAIAGGSTLATAQAGHPARAAESKANPTADVSGAISFVGTGYLKAPESYKEPTAAGGWTYIKGDFLKVECANLKIDAIDTTGKTVASTTAKADSAGTCSYDLRVPASVALTIHPDPASRSAILGANEDESPKEELKIADDESPKEELKTNLKTEIKTDLKNKGDYQWKSPTSLKISSDSQFIKLTPGSHSTVPLSLSADP